MAYIGNDATTVDISDDYGVYTNVFIFLIVN